MLSNLMVYAVTVTSFATKYIEDEVAQERIKNIIMITSEPYAFAMSVCGLVVAAGTWKFAGHVAGIKQLSGVIAGMIIIANLPSWIHSFTGACI